MSAAFEAGNRGTVEASLGGSRIIGPWAASATARASGSDGYYIVPESRRGAADRPATVHFVAGNARVDRFLGPARLFLKFDALAEDRDNGTALQHNSTSLGGLSAHYAVETTRD